MGNQVPKKNEVKLFRSSVENFVSCAIEVWAISAELKRSNNLI